MSSVSTKLAAILSSSDDAVSSCCDSLESIRQSLEWPVAAFWRADYDRLVLNCSCFETADPEKYAELMRYCLNTRLAPGQAGPGQIWLTREPIILDDVSSFAFPQRLLLMQRCGLSRYIGVPLRHERKIFGVFEFVSPSELPPDEVIQDVIRCGAIAGEYLSKQRLEENFTSTAGSKTRGWLPTEPIITIDAQSRIVSLNQAACDLFGFRKEDVLGQSIGIITPERYRQRHLEGVKRYLTTGQRKVSWDGLRLPILRSNGEELEVEISFGEVSGGESHLFSAFFKRLDPTERKSIA